MNYLPHKFARCLKGSDEIWSAEEIVPGLATVPAITGSPAKGVFVTDRVTVEWPENLNNSVAYRMTRDGDAVVFVVVPGDGNQPA